MTAEVPTGKSRTQELFEVAGYNFPKKPKRATIYAGIGTTCSIRGERGTITGATYTYGIDSRTTGLFVKADEREVMFYVELGQEVITCTCGADALNRGEHNTHCDITARRLSRHFEIIRSRQITRDDFDRITQLDTTRTEMGWR